MSAVERLIDELFTINAGFTRAKLDGAKPTTTLNLSAFVCVVQRLQDRVLSKPKQRHDKFKGEHQ